MGSLSSEGCKNKARSCTNLALTDDNCHTCEKKVELVVVLLRIFKEVRAFSWHLTHQTNCSEADGRAKQQVSKQAGASIVAWFRVKLYEELGQIER